MRIKPPMYGNPPRLPVTGCSAQTQSVLTFPLHYCWQLVQSTIRLLPLSNQVNIAF